MVAAGFLGGVSSVKGRSGLFLSPVSNPELSLEHCEGTVVKTPQNLLHHFSALLAQTPQLRLVDGGSRCAGRVEILHQHSWGTVCDYNWDLSDAHVVCRQMGCGEALNAVHEAFFGEGSGRIWLDELTCLGEESHVWKCPSLGWGQHYCTHKWDAGVICSGFVRLDGGAGHCSGRVEVNSGEGWIPVSGGNFTLPTAQVICADLGCGKAASVLGNLPFREPDEQVWAEEFQCEGQEPELWFCPRVPCPAGSCPYTGAVQVVCSGYTDIRLMKNGSSQCEGQVEMKTSGGWRTLCASHWNMANANVVCRQLGCGVAISTPKGAYFVDGGDEIWRDRFHCSGSESFLWNCPVSALGVPACAHGNTASVVCSVYREHCITVNGNSVKFLNLDHQRPSAAPKSHLHIPPVTVPSSPPKSIFSSFEIYATISAHFGKGSGPIWLDELNCTGKEAHVWQCPSQGWGQHNCRHKEDAGVICSEFLALRLVSEDQECAGWLEVFYNNTWGSVCHSPMEAVTLSVICRQLGCGDSGTLNFLVPSREGSRPHWVDGIRCRETDTSLWQCPSDPWKHQSCSAKEEAHIKCTGDLLSISMCLSYACREKRKLRLVNGGSRCAGRVEILHQHSWGTVCHNNWNLKDANVVCRQMGCGAAFNALLYAQFGEGSGPIWLMDLACTGEEDYLWNCPALVWRKNNCEHSKDAGVICSDSRQLRLVDGGSRCAGRVEILQQGSWGSICDDSWDLSDAHVVCRQLGCGVALEATISAHFGEGSGPIWLDELNCTGEEAHMWQCPSQGWGKHNCSHKKDAGVICSEFLALRLVSKDQECAGWLEVFYNNTWGSVCHSPMEAVTLSVICRQLGCGDSGTLNFLVPSREGSRPRWVDGIRCRETDTSLWQCPSDPWKQQSCSPEEEAHITCTETPQLRLVNRGSRCAGRVEILHKHSWGTVCDDSWNLNDAHVVCRQIGCGVALDVMHNAQFGEGSGPIWLDELKCTGEEDQLWKCPAQGWGHHDCAHDEDAGVICSGNQTQLLPQCNDSWSDPAGSAASEDSRQLRLVDGGSHCAGRVEILQQGSWGSICDDSWDLSDAHVVCRQLGCGVALEATISAHFGEGSGPIWLDELNCTGEEAHVWQCPSQGWGQHDCRHKEDAGVICSEFLALRLVSKDQECAGWLEIFYNNTWGSVCHSPMEAVTLSVICRQLGCGDTGTLNTSVPLREGSRPRWVDGIQCRKMDTSLWQCPSDPWKQRSCSAKEEAYIMCSGNRPKSCPATVSCTDKEKLRLRGGDSECSGRVEVWHEGAWGTVCDDSWSLAEAEVVCQQLGCGSALDAPGEAAFGPGNGSIWLDEVQCRGREPSLWACAAAPWGQSDCKHEEDAGVRCSGERTTAHPTQRSTSSASATVPGIFSLPGILCMILGALLFLVLIILGIQLLRWRRQCQALSTFEDAVDEVLYQEIDYPINPEKKSLLNSSEPQGQHAVVTSNGYDDVQELPVPEIPSSFGIKENRFFPEEGSGARCSQTGISLQTLKEADNSNMEDTTSLLVLRQEYPGYDDVEPNTMTLAASTLLASTVNSDGKSAHGTASDRPLLFWVSRPTKNYVLGLKPQSRELKQVLLFHIASVRITV
ncbi:antigen WC1.1-like [Ictidomys tridecemlineatus]|nr:antigen WC1.1-like [Ictidomys tridecemlineatus]